MKKYTQYVPFLVLSFFILYPLGNAWAEESPAMTPSTGSPVSEAPNIAPNVPPKIREAILEVLKPNEWLQLFQQYIRLPLPGTDVKTIEVDRGKVSELNIEVGRETGVDLLRFFQFVGKVLVIILEGVSQIIRGFINGI